jgi:hypothetical protein
MDVYLVSLLLIAVEVFFNLVVDSEGKPLEIKMPDWLKAVVYAAPILFVISYSGGALPVRDMEQAQRTLEMMQVTVDMAVDEGSEVLFISQRHLITFDYIEDVPLIHAHEKLLLQEMAMSQNKEYVRNFGQKLAEQQYALIFNDPLPDRIKDEKTVPLAAENNVVFEMITPLFNCAYQEIDSVFESNLAFSLLIPKDGTTCVNIEE